MLDDEGPLDHGPRAWTKRDHPTSPAAADTLNEQRAVLRDIVDAPFDRAENRPAADTDSSIHYPVEQRALRLGETERLLRSVIDSLDGALCIVGHDGSILDTNLRWTNWLIPLAENGRLPGAGGSEGGQAALGTTGTNFFDWCKSSRGMREIMATTSFAVQAVITYPPDVPAQQPDCHLRFTDTPPRVIKGRLGSGDGSRWVVVRVHTVVGHPRARAVVSLVDITEAAKTQRELRRVNDESERLALVARSMDHPLVITGPNGVIEWINPAFTRRTGYSQAEAVGLRRLALFDDECRDSEEFREFVTRLETSGAGDGEFQATATSGERYWSRVEVRPVRQGSRITRLVWVERDITQVREHGRLLNEALSRAEGLAHDLSRERALLAGVISAVPQMVFWRDATGGYLGCNAAYLRFRQAPHEESLLGLTDGQLGYVDRFAREIAEMEAAVMFTGAATLNREIDVVDAAGEPKSLLVAVIPLDGENTVLSGVIGVGADITHVHDMERKLAQANRLESIGQLAAGIAHEINTPIQYIADNTQFIDEVVTSLLDAVSEIKELTAPAPDASDGHGDNMGSQSVAGVLAGVDIDFLKAEIPAALLASREGLSRVAHIVRAMKNYAHPGTGRNATDVNLAIESTVEVCRNEWKYVAEMVLHLDPTARPVPCFEGDLKQVILNIIVNAAHAIDDERRLSGSTELGVITITTSQSETEFVISISDNGPGMSEDVSRRVFDHFFTTKEVGRGTGQGLSLAHSVIVNNHQGRIELETSPGQGAKFSLHLPMAFDEATGNSDTAEAW